ncbi:MAG: hypothetical protein NPIRA05_18410 [Nitrospirales bacterium]|nr:MAG: hypothetical protein NPIRA05_18410 [Nitrospirales bacterium]
MVDSPSLKPESDQFLHIISNVILSVSQKLIIAILEYETV